MTEILSSDFDSVGQRLAAQIDHTILAVHASTSEISYACKEAKRLAYAAVCVNPAYVAQARAETEEQVCVSALIGNPFGLSLSVAKAYEAEVAVKAGAQEIDLVLPAGWIREGEYQKITDEIEMVRRAVGSPVLLKATLLFDLLDDDAKVAGTVLCLEASCDYVTAMGASLSYRDIDLMYDITQGQRGIKAMGPIREWKVVERMLQSGMTRLGTTWGMNILREQQAQIRSAAKGWD